MKTEQSIDTTAITEQRVDAAPAKPAAKKFGSNKAGAPKARKESEAERRFGKPSLLAKRDHRVEL